MKVIQSLESHAWKYAIVDTVAGVRKIGRDGFSVMHHSECFDMCSFRLQVCTGRLFQHSSVIGL